MSGTRPGGINANESAAAFQDWADQQPVVTSCAFCEWTHRGTVLEGREAAAQHRAELHPTARKTRRRRGGLNRFNPQQPDFREEGLARAREIADLHKKRERAA